MISTLALPGCHSQGDTMDEARENIRDAIQGCIAPLNDRAVRQAGVVVRKVSV